MHIALDEMFEAAKTDEAAARQILAWLSYRVRSSTVFEREREGLIRFYGIPAKFLPHAHEWDFKRKAPLG